MLTLQAGQRSPLDESIRLEPPTPRVRANGSEAEEWSRLWFNLMGREWRSLALVPAAPDVSALPVAERFLECAFAYQSGPSCIVDAQGAAPGDVAAYNAMVAEHVLARGRVLLVLSSPLVSASAIPLARAADASLLVVPLGATAVRDARAAVAAVGHAAFLGSVTVRDR